MSHFPHHFSLQENAALFKRMVAALKPGGQLLVHEFVADDARTAHEPALMFALIMLASTERGNVYTAGEYRALMEGAGYDPRSMPLLELLSLYADGDELYLRYRLPGPDGLPRPKQGPGTPPTSGRWL